MKKIFFSLLILLSFFLCDNVFAINEDYFDIITFDKVKSYKGNSLFSGSGYNFSKVLSIHSFEGPFYSFYHDNVPSSLDGYTEFYKFNLTKELNDMFDTEKLITYDRSYYYDLIYYTKDINMTNLQDGTLNAPSNYSFITNDFDTLYNNYEVLDNDRQLLSKDFRQTTILNSYITYGRTQCKIADSDKKVYKCRITYQVDPNKFHKSASNPEEEARGAVLVFRFDNFTTDSGNFIAIGELGLNSELRGTDDMIPVDEELPPTVSEEQKSFLDYIIELPQTIINGISDLVQVLINGIIDGLKFLFIPSDDYFKLNLEVIDKLASEKLGFLYLPIELVKTFVDFISNVPDNPNAIFVIPKVDFMGHTIIPLMSINLIDIVNSNDNFINIYNIYKIVVSGFIVLWLCELAYKEYRIIFNGGNN